MNNILIIRYQTHGKRFEIPCFRNQVEDYMASDREDPPLDVQKTLAFPGIFFHCHRKQQATHSSLNEAFQTTDVLAIAAVILQRGEVLVNDKDRVDRRTEHKEFLEHVQLIAKEMLTNRFTGEQPELAEVKEEIQLCSGVSLSSSSTLPNPLALAAFFAQWIVTRGNIFCHRSAQKMTVHCTLPLEEEWNDFFLQMIGVVLPLERKQTGDTVELTFLLDCYLDRHPTPIYQELLTKSTSTSKLGPSQSESDLFNKQDIPFPSVAAARSYDTKHSRPQKAHKDEEADDVEGVEHAAVSKYESMTHKQLQDLCRQKKLSTGGKKHDMIDRLEALDETPLPKKKK